MVVSSWFGFSVLILGLFGGFVDRRLNFPYVVTLGFRYVLPVFALAVIVLLVLGWVHLVILDFCVLDCVVEVRVGLIVFLFVCLWFLLGTCGCFWLCLGVVKLFGFVIVGCLRVFFHW